MDVVIIGAGVAGALIGWKLSRAGFRVTILEAGPRVDRSAAVERYRASVVKGLHSPYVMPSHAPAPTLENLESHLRQEGPELFYGVYQRQVGGTTWHWLGSALRLLPQDLRLRSLYGEGRDWPLDYEELEPWYGEAETCLGVSGEGGAMPPIPSARVDVEFGRAAEKLGLRVAPLPQARNSRPYDGRPRCCGSASCIPICPVGAKYDATVHIRKAEAAGARVLENHVVSRLLCEPEGRIQKARYLRPDGTDGTLEGDLFILAAHSVETPRLLLNSACPGFPAGLANRSDQVGRNLMGGSAQMSWGLAPRPVYPYRAPLATSGIFDFRDGPERRGRSGFTLTIATDGWPAGHGPAATARTLAAAGLRGEELRHTVRDQVSRQVALVSTAEELPRPENRIHVAPEFPDALGIPRPRVLYHGPTDYTRRGLEQARELHQRLFDTMGVSEQRHAPSTDPAYILGTTRMGDNPADSVVNKHLRCHDHPNLYLVGGNVFPTTGTAPPTLTVAALALRLAASIT